MSTPSMTQPKEKLCFRGCGVMIHWDENVKAQSGKLIPLENNNEPHQCGNSDFNKRQAQGQGQGQVKQQSQSQVQSQSEETIFGMVKVIYDMVKEIHSRIISQGVQ